MSIKKQSVLFLYFCFFIATTLHSSDDKINPQAMIQKYQDAHKTHKINAIPTRQTHQETLQRFLKFSNKLRNAQNRKRSNTI